MSNFQLSGTEAATSRLRSKVRTCVATVLAASAAAAPGAVLLVSAAIAPAAMAQDYTSGVLTGRVDDANGNPVPGATVTVTSEQGQVRKATTEANGVFRVPALAVGSYTVEIAGQGFAGLKQRVSVAPTGSSYGFTLAAAGTQMEEVIVTASTIQDFNRTDTGMSMDVQDLASQVPLGRSITAVTLLAPSVSRPDATINASARRNQSLISASGTSAAESVYYINGLNVTDQRTFLGYGDLPFDFIQTVETKTGGYSAEFGRGTGGIVNIVTRSGSNEFHAGVSAYTSPESFRGEGKRAYQQGGSGSPGIDNYFNLTETDSSELSIWASGPIIKDKLFFFGVYNARDYESWGAATFSTPTTANGTQTQTKYDDPFWGGKIDWNITDDHRLEATVWSDKTTTEFEPWVVARSTFARTAPSPSYQSESGGTNQIYKYTGVFTPSFTLSALYGKVKASYLDMGDAVNKPALFDYGAGGGYINANRFGLYNLRGEDERETYRVDVDFYFAAKGDHHLRVGYDEEKLVSDAYSAYNGGAINYGFDQADCPSGAGAAGCINLITFANNGVFKATQTAAYIQDAWQVTDTFNLQLGVRWDKYDYKNINGTSYVKIDDQYAPRVGFTWDPVGDGLNRVYGSIGDYYLPIATNTSIRASSGEVYTDAYYQTQRGSDGKIVLGANGYPAKGAQIGPTIYYSPPSAPDPRAVAEQDLKPMFEREFSLGYEHQFDEGMLADWRVGARVVYRELKKTIEDTAIGDAVVRYCVRTNTACGQTGPSDSAFASLFPYVLINPGDEATAYIDLNGDGPALEDGSKNPAYNPAFVTFTAADMNLQEADRTYKALELTFERPFDGKWSLRGSYTLGESKGNYEGAVKSDIGQTDTSITQDFDHSANQLNADGYLPNHHLHTFKAFGNYQPWDWFRIGAAFTAQSGRKYGCIGYIPASVDPLAPQGTSTPSSWFCPYGTQISTSPARWNDVPTPRGSQGQTPWVYQFDLNLSFNLLPNEKYGSLEATVDVFNLFDSQTVTRVVETGELRSLTRGQRPAYYGYPRTYQAPRAVRIGLRYNF